MSTWEGKQLHEYYSIYYDKRLEAIFYKGDPSRFGRKFGYCFSQTEINTAKTSGSSKYLRKTCNLPVFEGA